MFYVVFHNHKNKLQVVIQLKDYSKCLFCFNNNMDKSQIVDFLSKITLKC